MRVTYRWQRFGNRTVLYYCYYYYQFNNLRLRIVAVDTDDRRNAKIIAFALKKYAFLFSFDDDDDDALIRHKIIYSQENPVNPICFLFCRKFFRV